MGQPLIILGASARAAAQSAIRAGYSPWCIDLFGDRDLRAIAPVRTCPPREYPNAMLRILDDAPADAPLLLTGAMENHPELVAALAFEHPLIGSAAEAIVKVRDPMSLPTLPRVKGLRFCKTRPGTSFAHRLSHLVFGAWGRNKYLIKPRLSGGGSGVKWWTPGQNVDKDHYLQQYIRGESYSAVFTADGWSAQLLGVTEQIIGEPAFGGKDFRYCGSIGPVKLSDRARAALSHLAVQLTQKFDVRGLFGVDMVMDWTGNLWPVEVNPRYVSSVEVIERALGAALLGKYSMAGRNRQQRPHRHVHGKAVIYAKQDTTLFDLYELFPQDVVADVPAAGQLVRAGRPVCSLFAHGTTRDDCMEKLRQMAAQLYERIEKT